MKNKINIQTNNRRIIIESINNQQTIKSKMSLLPNNRIKKLKFKSKIKMKLVNYKKRQIRIPLIFIIRILKIN